MNVSETMKSILYLFDKHEERLRREYALQLQQKAEMRAAIAVTAARHQSAKTVSGNQEQQKAS